MLKYFLISLFLLTGQNSIDKKDLIGHWEVDEVEINIPEADPYFIYVRKLHLLECDFSFNEDGTYTINNPLAKKVINEFWKLDSSEIYTSTDKYSWWAQYQITKIDKSQLIIKQNFGNKGYEVLTLKKMDKG